MRTNRTINVEFIDDFKDRLLSWAQQFEEVVWLDSNSGSEDFNQNYNEFDAVLALGAEKRIVRKAKNAFEDLKTFRSNVKDYVFGYLSYDLKNEIENLRSENIDHLGFSDLYFFQAKKIFFLKDHTLTISYIDTCIDELENDLKDIQSVKNFQNANPHHIKIKSRISKRSYHQKIENILDHIHRGDIYEVNFCQEFYAENSKIDPLTVYQKLNTISTPPFASFVKIQDQYLLSASPERFVKKKGDTVISQPIKGTARRSDDPTEDLKIATLLAKDPKEIAENIMIVDLVRNDLSKTAISGSVQVEELCKVYSFKQVHQLISTVVSKVDGKTDPVDIIKSLFPMGSMTGAPKISAMEIIEEQEETKRGLYSGAVGYIGPDDNFDFNVVIRSILYNQSERYISFTVGGAITSKSNIENEYKECLLKAEAMKRALKE